MSTNGITYGTTSTRMNTADLEVGQELVMVHYPRWGGADLPSTMTHWTITKILKTRLVIERDGREVRMLVHFDKRWVTQNGEVKTNKEGDGDWSNATYLYTLDDPKVDAVRESNLAIMRRRDTDNALKAFTDTKTKENAQAAIDALQAWIAGA